MNKAKAADEAKAGKADKAKAEAKVSKDLNAEDVQHGEAEDLIKPKDETKSMRLGERDKSVNANDTVNEAETVMGRKMSPKAADNSSTFDNDDAVS